MSEICDSTAHASRALLDLIEEEHHSSVFSVEEADTESQLSKQMKSVFSEGGTSTTGSTYNQGMYFMRQVKMNLPTPYY